MSYQQKIGRWGENIAAAYLEEKGYSIIGRNYSTREGEIDLIALIEDRGEDILVFVEVKTRTNQKLGYPEESFTDKKWKRMMRTIERYLDQKTDFEGGWQVDLIAIQRLRDDHPPDIRHFENIMMGYD